MAKPPRKPLDQGVKRTLKIVGGVVGVGALAMGYMTYSSSTKSADIQQSSSIGKVVTSSERGEGQISEATRAKLARVHEQEARDAQRQGKAYIPEMIFGEPMPVDQKEKAPAPPAPPSQPQESMPANRYAGDSLRPTARNDAQRAQLEAIEQGLVAQMQMVAGGLKPATAVPVALAFDPEAQSRAREEARAREQAQSQAANSSSQTPQGPELVGGDEIVAGTIITPINTDKSKFVLSEIVGGKLHGAQLRGQVLPMNMSGDIEDVGIRFSNMRFEGQHYAIDAIGLNEQTASDALDGAVDRRVFSRYVMPIVMAGLSGASTYFTARGTPSVSVAAGYNGEAVIVDQERASREDARNQGIGSAIDKAVQTGEQAVNRQASRPNVVEVEKGTPIGIMFNAPVYAK